MTKRLAEKLASYLEELGVRAKYLHSDIDTIERVQIISELREGKFDALIGINLLREGLDLPEVSLVAILDADKEGFLRSETALIQTCGRAARNEKGRVVMYADRITRSIQNCLEVTEKRRAIQSAYNKERGITPKSAVRSMAPLIETVEAGVEELLEREPSLNEEEIDRRIKQLEGLMKRAAKELDFEEAARYRDEMRRYQNLSLLA